MSNAITFVMTALSLELTIYPRPEKVTLENLPDLVLPIEPVGSSANPVVSELFVRYRKTDMYKDPKAEALPDVCNHVVHAIDAELRRQQSIALFGKRVTLHDRSTNGVKVDLTQPGGEELSKAIAQTKGQIAILILKHIFRPRPKTMVVLDTELIPMNRASAFSMVLVGQNGITAHTVDPVKFADVLAKATQPHGRFTLGQSEHTFIMAHPFINLTMAFPSKELLGIMDLMLARLTDTIGCHVAEGYTACIEFDPVKLG